MAPIFKNTLLSRNHLSKHMLAFAQNTGAMKQPQRCLVGSLHGEKLLLASTLLKWYLKQGLEVSKVCRVYQYRSARCYKKFGESVSDARRDGDANPDLALLAETSKLVGNSLYGKTITDKEKHTNTTYTLGTGTASLKVRSADFISLEELDDDFYEMEKHKKKVGCQIVFFSFFFKSIRSSFFPIVFRQSQND